MLQGLLIYFYPPYFKSLPSDIQVHIISITALKPLAIGRENAESKIDFSVTCCLHLQGLRAASIFSVDVRPLQSVFIRLPLCCLFPTGTQTTGGRSHHLNSFPPSSYIAHCCLTCRIFFFFSAPLRFVKFHHYEEQLPRFDSTFTLMIVRDDFSIFIRC